MKEKEWRSLTFKCFLLLLSVVTVCVIYSCMTAGRESLNAKAGQEYDMSDINNVDKKNNEQSEPLKSGKAGGKVIVIDAGHGGHDEGAVSFDGRINEKDYTLLIVKELKDILDKSDITAYYTRLSDKDVSKKERVKLANELQRRSTGKTLYILDEPTTGLHTHDVKRLIDIINRIVNNGDSVIIIEHNLDIIKIADYIIDIGPEGGEFGGTVVATGTPKEISENEKSYTGKFLKKYFE